MVVYNSFLKNSACACLHVCSCHSSVTGELQAVWSHYTALVTEVFPKVLYSSEWELCLQYVQHHDSLQAW